MNLAAAELERTTPRDRYADYCLWDYQPIAPPAGKLRSANLLWRAIEAAGGACEIVVRVVKTAKPASPKTAAAKTT